MEATKKRLAGKATAIAAAAANPANAARANAQPLPPKSITPDPDSAEYFAKVGTLGVTLIVDSGSFNFLPGAGCSVTFGAGTVISFDQQKANLLTFQAVAAGKYTLSIGYQFTLGSKARLMDNCAGGRLDRLDQTVSIPTDYVIEVS
jgi:hypothetical protein